MKLFVIRLVNNFFFFSSFDIITNLQRNMSTLNITLSPERLAETPPLSISPDNPRRSLRARSQSDILHSVNRRVISRPKKNCSGFGSSEEIRKIYLNIKTQQIKPIFLETICEEEEGGTEKNALITFIGNKKQKRSLAFSDGSNIKKTIVKKRKIRIKRFLGNISKKPKFSMEYFMMKMEAMHNLDNAEKNSPEIP